MRKVRRLRPLPALIVIGLGFAGCAAVTPSRHVSGQSMALQAPPSPWPSQADYNTIGGALLVRNQELFHERDWRRRSYGAGAAMVTLLTLRGHLLPGKCATFVNGLYDELYSLHDSYKGENWQPLKVWVRHDRSLRSACLDPSSALAL